jgi:hypothetical protein
MEQKVQEFYTYRDLASRWRVCEHTVRKWAMGLPRLRVGRKVLITGEAVAEWERRHLSSDYVEPRKESALGR